MLVLSRRFRHYRAYCTRTILLESSQDQHQVFHLVLPSFLGIAIIGIPHSDSKTCSSTPVLLQFFTEDLSVMVGDRVRPLAMIRDCSRLEVDVKLVMGIVSLGPIEESIVLLEDLIELLLLLRSQMSLTVSDSLTSETVDLLASICSRWLSGRSTRAGVTSKVLSEGLEQ